MRILTRESGSEDFFLGGSLLHSSESGSSLGGFTSSGETALDGCCCDGDGSGGGGGGGVWIVLVSTFDITFVDGVVVSGCKDCTEIRFVVCF